MIKKIHIEGGKHNVRVGMRQVNLSDTYVEKADGERSLKKNSPVIVYDTSGPYGDDAFKADFSSGLPKIRESWFARRKDLIHLEAEKKGKLRRKIRKAKEGRSVTQMYCAKKRIITPEMEYVAIRENQQVEALGLKSYITPDFVRKEVASGRAVIPANINHPELEPMIIGPRFLVKINNNIILENNFSVKEESKIKAICFAGADTLMDLSYEMSSCALREYIICNSPVPVGTSPLYQAVAKVEGNIRELSWEVYRKTLIEQLEQGVDFISVHAAMKKKHLQLTRNRLTGIVSHSGRILAKWMESHNSENFLRTHFSEICEIASCYDTVVSLGSGLRPGSIYDSNDRAQVAELSEMRGLIETAWKQYVQVMVEGPGHMPLNKIEVYMREVRYFCKNAPFFSPGMVTSDLAVGNEHISGSIGGAQMAWYGASLLGSLKIQADISDMERIYAGLISYKIAAHSADLAKGHPGAQVRDNAYSKALQENRKGDLANLLFSVKKKK